MHKGENIAKREATMRLYDLEFIKCFNLLHLLLLIDHVEPLEVTDDNPTKVDVKKTKDRKDNLEFVFFQCLWREEENDVEEAYNQEPAEEDDDWEDNLLPHVGVEEGESREDVDSSQSCPQVANLILTVIVQLQCSFIEEENGDERANDDHEEDTVAAIHDRKYEKARS